MVKVKAKRINIAIRLPKRIENHADKLSGEIGAKERAYFILDSKNFYPHMTLYSPEFPEKNIKKILKLMERIAAKTFRIKLQFLNIRCRKIIGVNFKTSKQIMNLHMSIVNKLNPLREGHIKKEYLTSNYQKDFSKSQIFNIEKYGHRSIGRLYQPHISLVSLKDKTKAEGVAKMIKWPFKEFTINKIGAFLMGDHGTCIKLIKEFPLK